MLTIDISAIQAGTCIWCGRAKDEVLSVAFGDKSFSGPLCHNDFKRAIRMKMLGQALLRHEPKPGIVPDPNLKK